MNTKDENRIKASNIVYAWAHEHGFAQNTTELDSLVDEVARLLNRISQGENYDESNAEI